MTDIVSLEEAYAYYINRTYRRLRMDFLRTTREAGYELTPEQYFILNRLWHHPGQSQTDLYEDLDDRANVTRGLQILVQRWLVIKRADPDDARRNIIDLTEQGRALLEKLNPVIVKERKRVYADLSRKDLADLRRILGKIEANLQSPSA
ncbi:MAG: MarR family transcriptional regulator [Leptospiraceae bacterium]|nr:MarR family transcriptional regulator [Leptospiraceae bacterium]